jgi:hypothetical protein
MKPRVSPKLPGSDSRSKSAEVARNREVAELRARLLKLIVSTEESRRRVVEPRQPR